jgi:hypothetical protein
MATAVRGGGHAGARGVAGRGIGAGRYQAGRDTCVPLTLVKAGLSRSLADSPPRSTVHMKARTAQISKLIVRSCRRPFDQVTIITDSSGRQRTTLPRQGMLQS